MRYDKHRKGSRLYLRTVPNITQPTRLDLAKSSVLFCRSLLEGTNRRLSAHNRTLRGHGVLADTSTTTKKFHVSIFVYIHICAFHMLMSCVHGYPPSFSSRYPCLTVTLRSHRPSSNTTQTRMLYLMHAQQG